MTKKALIILAVALFAVACNKGGDTSTANKNLTPMEELKAVAVDLDTKAQAIAQPITEVDTVVAEISALPTKLHIDQAKLMSMAKLTMDGTQVEITVDLTADATAKAEVEAALAKLKVIVEGLKATPDKVSELTKASVEALANVPVLATKVTTAAQAKIANPLATAADKVAAQADMDGVIQVQSEVQSKIEQIKGMTTELPIKATEALGKLSASLAGGT
jgi:hypothetical protein